MTEGTDALTDDGVPYPLIQGGELTHGCRELVKALMGMTGRSICILDPEDYRILESNQVLDEKPLKRVRCHEVFHNSPVPCWLNGSRCPVRLVRSDRRSVIVNHIHATASGTLEMMEVETIPVRNRNGDIEIMVQRTSVLENGSDPPDILASLEERTGNGLKVLSSLSMCLLESMSLEESLIKGTSQIRRSLSVDRAYIGRMTDGGSSMSVMSSSGSDREGGGHPGRRRTRTGKQLENIPPFIRRQLRRGEGYLGNTCDLPPEDAMELIRRGITSLAVIPILVGSEQWGCLGVETRGIPKTWDNGEGRILKAASRMLSSSIEKWQALEGLRESLDRTRMAFTGISEALSFTLEKRDPYTAGHQKRVVRIASAIGKRLGLPEERMECLQVAALLHDVGKIRIPIDILSRPGSLTDLEREFIRNHPQEGYEILSAVHFPWPVAEVVLEHHERFDGSGYPRGLSGDEIMIEASVLGLADVAEAMTSHRPYRPALSRIEMEEEIRTNRGRLYSPEVVDAFLDTLIDGTLFDK